MGILERVQQPFVLSMIEQDDKSESRKVPVGAVLPRALVDLGNLPVRGNLTHPGLYHGG